MSRRAASFACALAVAVAVASATGPVGATEPDRVSGRESLELRSEIEKVVRRLGMVRGGDVDTPRIRRADADALATSAAARAAAHGDADALAARGRAWADIGLGVGDGPARLVRTLAADIEGVGFDPADGALLVAPELFPLDDFVVDGPADAESQLLLSTGVRPDEPRVAHVLAHLDLRETWGDEPVLSAPTTDEVLARAAVAEGEANLHAMRYLFRALGLDDEIVRRGLDPGAVLGGTLLPRALAEGHGTVDDLLQFVYRDGLDAVAAAWMDGGPAAVARFRRDVAASRDVLHPDRIGTAVVDLAPDPGAGAPAVVDRIGEQGVIVLVSRGTGKDNLGLIAGDGWAGDLLARWEAGPDDPAAVTVWQTAWDSEQAAKDFAYAYRRVLEVRFRGDVPEDAADDAVSVVRDGRRWSLAREGVRVRVEVAPAS